jgi:hypothetical protein
MGKIFKSLVLLTIQWCIFEIYTVGICICELLVWNACKIFWNVHSTKLLLPMNCNLVKNSSNYWVISVKCWTKQGNLGILVNRNISLITMLVNLFTLPFREGGGLRQRPRIFILQAYSYSCYSQGLSPHFYFWGRVGGRYCSSTISLFCHPL